MKIPKKWQIPLTIYMYAYENPPITFIWLIMFLWTQYTKLELPRAENRRSVRWIYIGYPMDWTVFLWLLYIFSIIITLLSLLYNSFNLYFLKTIHLSSGYSPDISLFQDHIFLPVSSLLLAWRFETYIWASWSNSWR